MRRIFGFIQANPEVSIILGFLVFIVAVFTSYELALVAFGE